MPCLKENTSDASGMLLQCAPLKTSPKPTENRYVKSLFLLYTASGRGTASIYSKFVALLKNYISRGQTDFSSSAVLSGSALLPPSFPLSCQALDQVEAWSTWFTCQTSRIAQAASSWWVPQRVLNWETGVVFSWPVWKKFLAMVPAMDFIQYCWLENLLESLDNLITLSLHSLIWNICV